MTTLRHTEAAFEAIWAGLPLTVERAMFGAGKAPMFGAYTERPSTTFKPGEPLLTYLEPVGYLWKNVGDGQVTFGVSLDLKILKPGGEVLGGQKNFLSYSATSRANSGSRC